MQVHNIAEQMDPLGALQRSHRDPRFWRPQTAAEVGTRHHGRLGLAELAAVAVVRAVEEAGAVVDLIVALRLPVEVGALRDKTPPR